MHDDNVRLDARSDPEESDVYHDVVRDESDAPRSRKVWSPTIYCIVVRSARRFYKNVF